MRHLLVILMLLALPGGPANAADLRTVTWEELRPPQPDYEDPFKNMPYAQLQDLARILSLESLPDSQQTDETRAEAQALRQDLTRAGLDVDALFRQRLVVMENRRAAAESVNPALAGQQVRMPGYVLPLEIVDGKAVEFLLVPTVGACVHTPPPPANQVVFVSYPAGFPVRGLFDPVWITGPLRAQSVARSVGYSDGAAPVNVAYAMNAVIVEPYQ